MVSEVDCPCHMCEAEGKPLPSGAIHPTHTDDCGIYADGICTCYWEDCLIYGGKKSI